MRIDNSSKPVQPNLRDNATAASSKSVGTDGVRDRLSTSVDPKSVDGLLKQVGSTTEIRESVVNDTKAKIQNGEFLARQSAVDTASAILDL